MIPVLLAVLHFLESVEFSKHLHVLVLVEAANDDCCKKAHDETRENLVHIEDSA